MPWSLPPAPPPHSSTSTRAPTEAIPPPPAGTPAPASARQTAPPSSPPSKAASAHAICTFVGKTKEGAPARSTHPFRRPDQDRSSRRDGQSSLGYQSTNHCPVSLPAYNPPDGFHHN